MKRFTWEQFVDKAFWMLLISIAGYATTRFDKMTDSLQALNEKMAVVVTKVAEHDKRLDQHDLEIQAISKHGFSVFPTAEAHEPRSR